MFDGAIVCAPHVSRLIITSLTAGANLQEQGFASLRGIPNRPRDRIATVFLVIIQKQGQWTISVSRSSSFAVQMWSLHNGAVAKRSLERLRSGLSEAAFTALASRYPVEADTSGEAE